ncbi:hypothetical protein [Nostoc sp. CMAA1605]|nr:hypothetical protein [Nostoc sp. CMAA1605]
MAKSPDAMYAAHMAMKLVILTSQHLDEQLRLMITILNNIRTLVLYEL